MRGGYPLKPFDGSDIPVIRTVAQEIKTTTQKGLSVFLVIILLLGSSSCATGWLTRGEQEIIPVLEPVEPSFEEEQDPWVAVSYDQRYGYKALSSAHKGIYDRIHDAVFTYDRSIDFGDKPVSSNDFMRILRYYADDHPEVFWLEAGSFVFTEIEKGLCQKVTLQYIGKNTFESYNSKTGRIEGQISDSELDAMRKDFDNNIDAALALLAPNDNELMRELKIYNYIADTVKYNDDLMTQVQNNTVKRPITKSAYGAAVERSTVCTGFAKLLGVLLNAAGIECLMQYGEMDGEGHQWNIVRLEGRYYHVDVTQPVVIFSGAEATTEYVFFNVSDSEIKDSHTIQPALIDGDYQVNYLVPPCYAEDKSFEAYFGLHVAGTWFNEKDFSQKIRRLHDYELSGLFITYTVSGETMQEYLNKNIRTMRRLAAGRFVWGDSYYAFEKGGKQVVYIEMTQK